jgi:predicted nuclease of predicted toxin-antitoxin system
VRLLLDHNLDVRLAPLLTREGHDVAIVGIDLPAATRDESIIEFALAEQRIILTEDLGFGERVVRHRSPNPGIVLYRLKDASLHERFALTTRALLAVPQLSGRLVVISSSGIRVRR